MMVGLKAYLVGGCVRDRLLGLATRDRDWVVVGVQAADLLARGFRAVGKDVTVFLHPDTGEEYTLAASLDEDLRRRDLTVNAMAMDEAGTLIDPLGGAADLAAGMLRHVGPGFASDPIRILRTCRFAARFDTFAIAAQTRALMTDLVAAGALDKATPERVWLELDKALGTPRPSRFVVEARQCGALARVLPEVDALFGVPQRADHHPEIDTGRHTMMVVDLAARLTEDRAIRFAALVHDLGKGTTPSDRWPSHHGHEERGAELVASLVRRLAGQTRYADLGRHAARWHGLIHNVAELRPGTMLDVLMAVDAFRRPGQLEAVLIAAEADKRGRLGREADPYPQADHWRQALAAAARVTARDLIVAGHQPGPRLAAIMRQRRAEAIRALRLGTAAAWAEAARRRKDG